MENNPTQQNTQPAQTPTPPVGKKTKFNKTLLLVVGLVILTIVLLALSLTARNSGSLPIIGNNDGSNETIAFTSLSISEDVRVAEAGGYETDVIINSGENQITGIQLELTYDPRVLTDVDINPGSYFTNPTVLQKEIDETNGTIKYLLGTTAGSEPVTGEGPVAVISFNKTGDEETSIEFSTNTLVTDGRYAESVLSETTSGLIGTLPASTSPSTRSAVPAGTQASQ